MENREIRKEITKNFKAFMNSIQMVEEDNDTLISLKIGGTLRGEREWVFTIYPPDKGGNLLIKWYLRQSPKSLGLLTAIVFCAGFLAGHFWY